MSVLVLLEGGCSCSLQGIQAGIARLLNSVIILQCVAVVVCVVYSADQ
jgi:hypothetical protein